MVSPYLRPLAALLAGAMAAVDLPRNVDVGSVSYMVMPQLKASCCSSLFHHQLVTILGMHPRPDDM